MVALVALPLALGFGIASGAGARAGLITAVVAGIVAAVFGGSRVQVSGPTGAMTVVLVPIVAAHGVDGVLVVGVLAGLILIGLAISGAGRAIRYLPVTVVEGFTLGIAIVIALQQVPLALGVPVEGERVLEMVWNALRDWVAHPVGTEPMIALLVTVLTLGLGRWAKALPAALIAVVLATVAVWIVDLPAQTIGTIPSILVLPSIPAVPWADLDGLVLAALAVAALAALESLLSATVADGLTVGERHDPDRELFGQGLANLAASVAGGIPATAAIARTAVNVRSGARTRLAAVFHGLVLLAAAAVAAPLVAQIPTAALAGVLIATAIHMVEVSSLRPLLAASRSDAAALWVTAATTVIVDLVVAVLIGLVVAGFFTLRAAANASRLDQEEPDPAWIDPDTAQEERRLLDEHVVVYRLEGALFFAAAYDFLMELASVSDVRAVVLRMGHITMLDATGARLLAETIRTLERKQITVLLSSVRPAHRRMLDQLGVYQTLAHERHVFETTPEAIRHAVDHAARVEHEPGA